MKKILEYSAIIYAFLIFINYSYLDTYYRCFDIQVYSFLDPSEILLLFMKNASYMVFLFIAIFLVYFIVYAMNVILNNSKEPSKQLKEIKITNPFKTFESITAPKFILLSIVVGIAFVFMKYIDPKNEVYFSFILFGIVFLGIYTFLDTFSIKFGISRQNSLILFLGVVLCTLSINIAIVNSKRVKDKSTDVQFYFEYESKAYASNDTLTFIGATANYFFLKNLVKSDCYVFPKSEIKNLKLNKMVTSKMM